MKRIISLLLVLCMCMALTFAFTSCGSLSDLLSSLAGDEEEGDGEYKEKNDPERNEFIDGIGGVSETYEGAVSEDYFSSAEEAAEAYVEMEIAGKSYASITEVESKGELSDKEVKSLGIPAELSDGIDSVEKLEVSYVLDSDYVKANSGRINLASEKESDSTKKVIVYVIKYGPDWKYFSPMPVKGNTITRSYYDSVFNSESYKNCTLNSVTKVSAVVKGSDGSQTETVTIESTITQYIKYDNNKIYFEQTIEANQNGVGNTQTIHAYLEEDEDGYVRCYVRTDPTSDYWYSGSLYTLGFTKLEEITPFYKQYLDYTYFTKTSYGFALEDENAKQYLETALSNVEGFTDMFSGSDMDLDMFAEYYVSGGVLSGMRMDANIGIEMAQQGVDVSVTETVTNTITCTNYGSTSVEIPDNVR